jgi:hypothetical protein
VAEGVEIGQVSRNPPDDAGTRVRARHVEGRIGWRPDLVPAVDVDSSRWCRLTDGRVYAGGYNDDTYKDPDAHSRTVRPLARGMNRVFGTRGSSDGLLDLAGRASGDDPALAATVDPLREHGSDEEFAAVNAVRLALMKRVTASVLLIGAVSGVVATMASGQRQPVPILTGAYANSDSRGFGYARPNLIYLGGDPSGLFCHIRWLSWGGQFAVGTGTGWFIPRNQPVAGGHQAPGVVVLYRFGTWQGLPAYTKFNWYFPQGGSTAGGVTRCTV